MRALHFVKMEGAGNDYVYVNGVHQGITAEVLAPHVAALADRHFGVGGDGVILLAASAHADVRMVMWNRDGSRGSMCGNGLRCLAKLAYDDGVVADLRLTVQTDGGVRTVELRTTPSIASDGRAEVDGARVDMGPVRVQTEPLLLQVAGRTVALHPGDAGNPHAVVFVESDLETFPVLELGSVLQRTPPFVDGVNVEFVRVLANGELQQRTFERGAGETLACGSGATVAAVAAVRTGRLSVPPSAPVRVHLRGGTLAVHVGDAIVMEGPAREVFRGVLDLSRLAAEATIGRDAAQFLPRM